MTTVVEEAKEGSSLGARETRLSGQKRACATSVTPGELPSPGVVTDSIRRAWQVASLTATFLAGMLNKPGSLVHAQPPTFAQARDRHHECAGHFGSPLLKLLRLAWGYVHLLILKPALNLAEWLTESPARFTVALALSAVIWFFA